MTRDDFRFSLLPILPFAITLATGFATPQDASAQSFAARATVLGGVKTSPSYFGSDDYEVGPTASLSLDYLRLPGGFQIGSREDRGFVGGFRPRFSFRYLNPREASDNPELRGLDDVDTSVEIGAGLGYDAEDFRIFADLRNGVIGHHDWAGVVGADAITRPTDALTLSAGPRVNFGGDDFMDTYFSISAAEAAASGLPAYDASGGLTSVGIELSARYDISDRWGLEGVAAYDRLVDDARDSPIVGLGSEDQYEFRFGITRDISLGF